MTAKSECLLATLLIAIAPVSAQAQDVTDRDARRIATTATTLDEKAILEIYLVLQGDTGRCGRIESPTWLVVFKSDFSGRGVPGLAPHLFIDAHTGKSRGCPH
jgi:hypothetical protein